MLKKEAIKLILEYYNELREDLVVYERNDINCDGMKGQLCAIRYILISVYGFKTNDKRF